LTALERSKGLSDEDVRAALHDPSSSVRRRAAGLAASHPDVGLLGALGDSDASVAETAAWALGEQQGTSAPVIAALTDMASSHADALCREAAVAALGALGHPDGLPAILAATTDKPAVRRRAVLALAPFDGPDVDAALRRALEDRDWQVRQAAEDLTS
jgi:HEAT repeat protein